jgi:hypothetical protein
VATYISVTSRNNEKNSGGKNQSCGGNAECAIGKWFSNISEEFLKLEVESTYSLGSGARGGVKRDFISTGKVYFDRKDIAGLARFAVNNKFIKLDEVFGLQELLEAALQIELNKKFLRKMDDIEMSIPTAYCLKNANIECIGELVQKTEEEMLRVPNFGRKSLNEIKGILAAMGLHLGMEITNWAANRRAA